MITSMNIRNVAAFDNEHGHIDGLKKLNFFYGSNGSGKTTISRVLAESKNYSASEINWENNESSNTIVYNHDFVKNNFGTSTIPGIYTMGEGSIEIEKKIEELRKDYKQKQAEKQTLLNGIPENDIRSHFDRKIDESKKHYEEVFWGLKENVKGTELDEFLGGYRNSKSRLFEKLLKESRENHSEDWTKEQLITYMKLKKQAEVSKVSQIVPVQDKGIYSIEQDPIFAESIVGKSNSTIGALIEKIGNSQWVLGGRKFIEKSEGKCPFCQQELPNGFSKALERLL